MPDHFSSLLLTAYGKEKGIHFTAYSPLGNNITGKPRVVDSDEVKAIAQKSGVDPAQVLVAWITQKGFSVIPKSVTPSRIESNFRRSSLYSLTLLNHELTAVSSRVTTSHHRGDRALQGRRRDHHRARSEERSTIQRTLFVLASVGYRRVRYSRGEGC
jgi:diketogulonate reductase-like aldo/keto reductase